MHMKSEEFLSQIVEAKVKWKEIEKLYQEKLRMLSKREQLEQAILKFKKKLEETPHSTFPSLQNQLNFLLQEQKQIDCLLDEVEELVLEDVAQAKEKLLEAIFQSNSQHQLDYSRHQSYLTQTLSLVQGLQLIAETLNQLQHRLEVVKQGRQRVKGLGLAYYFIGMSPNHLIEQHLNQSAQLIERLLSILDAWSETPSDVQLTAFYGSLHSFLQNLHKQLKKTWGFKHLDQIIIPAKQSVNEYLAKTQEWQQQFEQQKNKQENDFKEWMEQF